MGYDWKFGPVFRNFDLLLVGLGNTLLVTAVCLVFGLLLGLVIALLRLSHVRAITWPLGFVIDFLRIVPPLVQLMWVFFALPILIDVRMTPFIAACVTLSIQSSAFFAEVFRGGIISIEKGQWEAARSLAMPRATMMRRIILPQAVSRMIPTILERAIELLKTTSLVSAVSYADLLFQATQISQQVFRPLETFTVAAGLYLAVILPCSLF
ncbi:MAG: amino acid ABC transporter permease, partial [Oricola sp.]|nr:amino acid ABC transporter permease [Oricola sp.]